MSTFNTFFVEEYEILCGYPSYLELCRIITHFGLAKACLNSEVA